MKLQEYGSVAKASVYSALGFAKNHKEYDCSSCYRCEHYDTILRIASDKGISPESLCGTSNFCKSCKKKKNTYVNEKNRYGSDKGKLNAGSVLLYLFLHLCSPTGNGVISSFSVSEAASFLGCDHKSIHANLRSLLEKNYILYAKTHGRGIYTVMILSYTDAFKPAKEGGRGYITISKDLLLKGLLSERRSINLLRLDLRAYMDIDNGDTTKISCSKSMEQMRCYLPEYFRPGMIHNMISEDRTLYSMKHTNKYSFFLNPELNAKVKKSEKRDDAYYLLENFLNDINSYIHLKREDHLSLTNIPKEYVPVIIAKIKSGNLNDICLSKTDFEDLLQMSVQYTYQEVYYAMLELLTKSPACDAMAPIIRKSILASNQAAA